MFPNPQTDNNQGKKTPNPNPFGDTLERGAELRAEVKEKQDASKLKHQEEAAKQEEQEHVMVKEQDEEVVHRREERKKWAEQEKQRKEELLKDKERKKERELHEQELREKAKDEKGKQQEYMEGVSEEAARNVKEEEWKHNALVERDRMYAEAKAKAAQFKLLAEQEAHQIKHVIAEDARKKRAELEGQERERQQVLQVEYRQKLTRMNEKEKMDLQKIAFQYERKKQELQSIHDVSERTRTERLLEQEENRQKEIAQKRFIKQRSDLEVDLKKELSEHKHSIQLQKDSIIRHERERTHDAERDLYNREKRITEEQFATWRRAEQRYKAIKKGRDPKVEGAVFDDKDWPME